MPWSVAPVKQGHGADFDANAISGADVPVDSHVCSMNALFFRRFNGSPDVVSIVLTSYFPILLEVRINWQSILTFPLLSECPDIRLSGNSRIPEYSTLISEGGIIIKLSLEDEKA